MLAKKKVNARPTITLEETKVEDIIDDKDILKKMESAQAEEMFDSLPKTKKSISKAAAQRSNWQNNEVTESLDGDIQAFLDKQAKSTPPPTGKVIDTRPTVDTKPTPAINVPAPKLDSKPVEVKHNQ